MKDQSINYYRIEKAIEFLEQSFRNQPDLDAIARSIHLSPFHFQRLFLDRVGISPKKFIQYLTMDHLKASIHQSKNVVDAAEMAGLSSQSRVYDLFTHIEGMSPQQYKSGGGGMEIIYGYHATQFGICFIAIAERGICELHFIDEEMRRNEFSIFSKKWHFATLTHQPDLTQTYVKRIFKPDNTDKLQLLLRGTRFQIKIWEALLKIPFGHVNSYQQIATQTSNRGSVRAVGTAAGRNPISYLIPCHRIITQHGDVGRFQLGRIRKKTMIAWEMASVESARLITIRSY